MKAEEIRANSSKKKKYKDNKRNMKDEQRKITENKNEYKSLSGIF